eukprot:gnl/MRDRNA2_/MRDRNA2_83978_c0_seq1.p1 gnl/MRDRNA2_/MRDRNA2_83978_c0~~gnl/MRDRNA2_/MRDRNA2_83978_c0_seq1.p1  ORF type:complete len:130 (-),score=17.52 gnl/MRDRNA2_/MRDRNA2_83978_c0_seq1:290-679(-)
MGGSQTKLTIKNYTQDILVVTKPNPPHSILHCCCAPNPHEEVAPAPSAHAANAQVILLEGDPLHYKNEDIILDTRLEDTKGKSVAKYVKGHPSLNLANPRLSTHNDQWIFTIQKDDDVFVVHSSERPPH